MVSGAPPEPGRYGGGGGNVCVCVGGGGGEGVVGCVCVCVLCLRCGLNNALFPKPMIFRVSKP